MIQYLNLNQILVIHEMMIKEFGGSLGIREQNLLESAIARPRMSVFGEDAYPSLFMKVAVLFHSIIKNHPFLDGNKRTAFAAAHMMLLRNGYDTTTSDDENIKMCLNASEDKIIEDGIAKWFEENTKKRT